MPTDDDSASTARVDAGHFQTTHWSVVLAAGQRVTPQSAEALEKLCRTYWYPLYAYIRRQGYDAHDAQDLTQAFFARFLEKNYLGDVDRAKGKFRSFLLASLKHFLANEWDKARAKKRGGAQTFIPLDNGSAETRYGLEPAHDETADKIYERRWALTLLDQVLARLQGEYVAAGKTRSFDELKVFLTGEKSSAPYSEVAAKLKLTEGAVKVAVHRLRHRYRELLRAEIAQTVGSPDEIDAELRHLFAALS